MISEYFTISNCVFNFSFLSLVLYEILGESQIYIRGPCAPRRPPSENILLYAQVGLLAHICIIVNFQLRSSINAGLTESSLYNRFCIERSTKIEFLGNFGDRGKIFGGKPLGMQWPPIYVVWWKKYGDALNTLVCKRGKEITKRTECLRREGYISPLRSAYPLNP